MKEKWVIFDVMGVIFTVGDDTNDLLVPYIKKKNNLITKEYINEIYIDASLGKISSDEFWSKMNICKKGEEDKICKNYLDTCLTIDENFVKTAKKLKEKYYLAMLSNDVSEWSTYLRKKFGLDELIEFSVISGDVKCRKPSAGIYKIAIEKTGAKPEYCVFIDDRDKNLVSAENEGMRILKFNRDGEPAKLEKVLSINSFLDIEKTLEEIL